jgi:mono/diheme cytochrome c family protein
MKFSAVVIVLAVAIQFIPYGRDHVNPPIVAEPQWDSPRTRELAKRTCFDCHSNETVWPAYASVAPVSWLVQHDVDEGRAHLNFSEFNKPQTHFDDAPDEIRKQAMPPSMYTLMHSSANLSDAEFEELARGLQQTAAAKGAVRPAP